MHNNKNNQHSRFASSAPSNEWMIEFMTQTRPTLFAILLPLLNKEEAEEVAQEAYLKVFVALKAEKMQKPASFLMKVAKNLAFSYLRHKKVVNNHVQDATNILEIQQLDNQQLEQSLDQALRSKSLVDAINQLPTCCRQVFIYRKLQDKSHSEIADIMQISKKTVENHLSKGMLLCRQYLLETEDRPSKTKKGAG